MERVPFHKMKWYVGTKIQKDLILYTICISLLSQAVVASHIFMDNNFITAPYAHYITVILQIAFFAFIIYGFWLSNRIAGPLFRLKRHLDEVAEGKTDPEIQFRKNDYCSELAESFNAVARKRLTTP